MELLDEYEVRVLAVLVEKAVTTPEYYPLTLNALVNACNQKSNRDPVVDYTAAQVNEALLSLKEKGLIRVMMGLDSRVPKYRHYFSEAYELTPQEEAVLAVLMLRGAQTLGELRTRSERLYAFHDVADVEIVLEGLMTRSAGALVMRLPRQSGQKDSRYVHLLSGEPIISEESSPPASLSTRDRLQQLEEEMAMLREEMATLREEFNAFRAQFEES